MARRWLARWIALLVLVTLWSCDQRDAPPVRIAINPWPGYEFLFLAREKGYFREEGVAVDLVELESLSDARRALERGTVDGMATTLIEVLQARARSQLMPKVVLIADFSSGADVIVAGAGINGIEHLRGRRIGTEVASLGMFILARALEQAGLGLDDVTVVPMSQRHIEQAFSEGAIDAAVTYPPFSVSLLKRPGLSRIFDTRAMPREVIDVVSIDSRLLDERPRDMAAIIRAWNRAVVYSQDHPDEAHAIMARRIGITVEEFRDSLNGIHILSEEEQREMFEPGGVLDTVAAKVETLLRASGQMDRSVLATPIGAMVKSPK